MTRDGGTRPHFGVDYSGEVGDPVSAMYEGDVIKVGLGRVMVQMLSEHKSL